MLDNDHKDIINEHTSELEGIINTLSGGLLKELVNRKVITQDDKDSIKVSLVMRQYKILNYKLHVFNMFCLAIIKLLVF